MQNSVRKNLPARLWSEEAEAGVTLSVQLEGRGAHKRNETLSFLERLAESVSDNMLDKEELNLQLMKKQDVNDLFCPEYWSLHGKPCPTSTNSVAVWMLYRRNKLVRKHRKFTRCSICEGLDSAICWPLQLQKELRSLKMKRMDHL